MNHNNPLQRIRIGFLCKINNLKMQRCTEVTYSPEVSDILDIYASNLTPNEIDWRGEYNQFMKLWSEERWSDLHDFIFRNSMFLTSARTGPTSLKSEDIQAAIRYCS
jgi:hypothetical protein